MKASYVLSIAAAAALFAAPAVAQEVALNGQKADKPAASAPSDSAENPELPSAAATSVLRPVGKSGLNLFEAPKFTGPFDGVRVTVGGAFSLNFQALEHENTAAPVLDAKGVNTTQLADIRPGINLPNANLNLGVQLAPGINMVLESYMSSRHHNEFWVKGGYASIDASPINVPILNRVMQYTTIRAGMYEPNYGDAIFRRSDNGNSINNPFAENLLMDAFTTEPGAEVMVRVGDAFVMGGFTTGENKGNVANTPLEEKPSLLGKIGFDRQLTQDLRVRLSGSAYHAASTPRTTLYGGDRAGSNYWGVIDNAAAASFTNGRIGAAFPNELTAIQINPFVKFGGLELFGVLERAEGKATAETVEREVSQYAGDVVYRLLDDRLYVAGRYNVVKGDLSAAPTDNDVTIDRTVFSAGWFIAPNMLTKVEYVTQGYDGFAPTDIRNGAKFNGFVIQGSIAF